MTDPTGRAGTPTGQHQPWDLLSVPEPGALPNEPANTAVDNEDIDSEPSFWARMAAGWADLVAVGIMTTTVLVGVLSAGYGVRVAALPWAVGVAVLWWALCSVLCLRIRRGTPGMLIAGVIFSDEVAGYRIARTIIAAGVIALFLGVPALPGGRTRSLFSLASGSSLTSL